MREMMSYSVLREELGAAGVSSEGAQGEGKKLEKSTECTDRNPSGTKSWARDGFPGEEGGSWGCRPGRRETGKEQKHGTRDEALPGSQGTQCLVPAQQMTCWVTLGQPPYLSQPPSPHMQKKKAELPDLGRSLLGLEITPLASVSPSGQ